MKIRKYMQRIVAIKETMLYFMGARNILYRYSAVQVECEDTA